MNYLRTHYLSWFGDFTTYLVKRPTGRWGLTLSPTFPSTLFGRMFPSSSTICKDMFTVTNIAGNTAGKCCHNTLKFHSLHQDKICTRSKSQCICFWQEFTVHGNTCIYSCHTKYMDKQYIIFDILQYPFISRCLFLDLRKVN